MLARIKSFRFALSVVLLTIVFSGLLVETWIFVPQFATRPLGDYEIYRNWGTVESGGAPDPGFSLTNYYPLPSTLWVFIPLSILPNWFRIIWTIVPFLLVLWLLKKPGVILWLYHPMLIQGSTGQMDGWLLLPLYWLLENKPWMAGFGAVMMLFKPQLSFITVLYALASWIVKRDFRNLASFAATLSVVYFPAFIVNPIWPLTMIERMGTRATESLLPTRGATLWAWAWHGGVTLWLLPFLSIAVLALCFYVFTVRRKRAQVAQLLGLLVTPVLYASNFVTVIPILETSRQCVILTISSWVAVAIDTWAGGWGGAYVIIPITALVLLAIDRGSFIRPIPTEKTAR